MRSHQFLLVVCSLLGDQADVTVTGMAPSAANQQNASKFTVRIIKKP